MTPHSNPARRAAGAQRPGEAVGSPNGRSAGALHERSLAGRPTRTDAPGLTSGLSPGPATGRGGHGNRRFDFLVLGSGLAGLHYALRVADVGDVAIITKRKATDSATDWAQGGIAAVMDPSDSFDAHVRDTLNAGAGLCHEDTVRFVVERGPAAIQSLRKSGVEFDPARHPDGPGTLRPDARRRAHPPPHPAPPRRHRPRDRALVARPRPCPSAHQSVRGPLRDRPDHDDEGRSHRIQSRARRLRTRCRDRRGARLHRPDHTVGHRRAPARSTSTPAIPTSRPATASRWPIEPGPRSRTWNSCSSIRPACSTHRRSRS